MQNIIAAKFEVESEGYQAITTLSKMPVTDHSVILEMALIKNTNGALTISDVYCSSSMYIY